MNYRKLGRTGIHVSEIGYGMWGMGEWKGSDDEQSRRSLDYAVEHGCNFFDTAWAYGAGKSEKLLGELVKRHPNHELILASKIPPKNRTWPSEPHFDIQEVFPSDYIEDYVDRSLRNLGVERLHVMQFHVWEDSWHDKEEWQATVEKLKALGKVKHFGISINRWEPENSLESLKTGALDTVQVIYNLFDQAPEDELFPLCQEEDIGVIARVPFDEGSLTGKIRKNSSWPEGDWRNTYFVPENLKSSVEHAETLKQDLPEGMPIPEAALRFILHHPAVSTTIPGMRQLEHVKANLSCSDKGSLPEELIQTLRKHRWDREPTCWSQ